jgi:hypothetical protein
MVISALPLLVILFTLELLLVIMPNDFRYKNKQLLNKADSIETLILGGSHTFYDLDPAQINANMYNLAFVSQSLEFDYLLLNKYINDLPNLKQVVLMVAYLTYSQRWDEAETNWRKYHYYKFYDITPPIGLSIQKFYPELCIIPMKQVLKKVGKYIHREPLITCTETGWCSNYYKSESTKNFEREAKLAIMRHENGSIDFSPGIQSMEKIIGLCHQKDIQIIMISFPVRPEYIINANKYKFEKNIKTSEDFSKLYSNIKYYNYINDPRITGEDFYDADHLNDEGAKKFSRILKKEVFNK